MNRTLNSAHDQRLFRANIQAWEGALKEFLDKEYDKKMLELDKKTKLVAKTDNKELRAAELDILNAEIVHAKFTGLMRVMNKMDMLFGVELYGEDLDEKETKG